jgi:TonB-linked SusC/RagA family outer membrane protein
MIRTSRSRGVVTTTVAAMLLSLAGTAQAQQGAAVVTGRVTAEDGTPLPGANVYITEMSISVGTSSAGVYTINVPAARVSGQTVQLRVRSVGFAPQVQPVTLRAGSQTFNFSLKRDALRLSEVVVTGVSAATEQIRTPFTVQKVDTTMMPVVGTSMVSQLQGKVPGANITSASGRPGASPVILMRGPTSINATNRSQQPLFIVDGVMLQGSFTDINPNDIESIEIVKGAAAGNLYGARAGAGVINVTTKSGKNAREGIKFGLRAEAGLGDIPRSFDIAQRHILGMDPTSTLFCSTATTNGSPCTQLIDLEVERRRINDVSTAEALAPLNFRYDGGIARSPGYGQLTGQFQVNRFNETRDVVADLVTPNGFANTNLDVRGRVGNTGVYGSVSNLTNQGAIKYVGGYYRNSARANIDHRFGDQLSMSLNTFYSTQRDAGSNQEGGNGFFRLTRTPAFVDLDTRDSQGRLYIRSNPLNQGSQNDNPLYSFENAQRVGKGQRFIGGSTLKYDPFEWMTLEGNFSYDRNSGDSYLLQDRGFRSTTLSVATANGSLSQLMNDDQSLNTSGTVTFRKTLGDLRTSFSARYLYEQQYFTDQDNSGNNLVVPGLRTLDAVVDQDTKDVGSGNQSIRGLAYMGSLQLDYKDRYLVQANLRRDGSSLFGRDNRWTNLPGISASWIASREGWWFGGDALSLLKLRAAYGETAQRPSFAAQYATFTIGAGGTLNPAQLGNPDLRPEIRKEFEYGVETEFFNRVGLSVTYAVNDIEDQILPVPLSFASGFQSQWTNAGTLQNKSLEVSLDLPIINRPNVSWSARIIGDRLRTKVTQLNVAPYSTGPNLQGAETMFRIAQGEIYGTIYGRDFVRNCNQLPGTFSSQCSMNGGDAAATFRPNNEGYIVYVGAGNQLSEGVTKNLWRARLPAAQAPWGTIGSNTTQSLNWGMPILLRDSTGAAATVALGQTLPKFRYGVSQNFRYKRFTAYGLVDAAVGGKVYNEGYHWSLGDFMSGGVDQDGATIETAKPLGYYWRVGPGLGGNAAGTGGFYDILGPNREVVEDASYAKLRELAVSYRLGRLPGLNRGDWTFGIIGRNLLILTNGYRGFDPEVGVGGGTLNNAALNAVDRFSFPNLRQVTFSVSSSF